MHDAATRPASFVLSGAAGNSSPASTAMMAMTTSQFDQRKPPPPGAPPSVAIPRIHKQPRSRHPAEFRTQAIEPAPEYTNYSCPSQVQCGYFEQFTRTLRPLYMSRKKSFCSRSSLWSRRPSTSLPLSRRFSAAGDRNLLARVNASVWRGVLAGEVNPTPHPTFVLGQNYRLTSVKVISCSMNSRRRVLRIRFGN